MIGNAILDFVTSGLNALVAQISAVWMHVDTSQFVAAWRWLSSLDEWVPVSDLAVILGIIAVLGTVAMAVKIGLFLLARFVI